MGDRERERSESTDRSRRTLAQRSVAFLGVMGLIEPGTPRAEPSTMSSRCRPRSLHALAATSLALSLCLVGCDASHQRGDDAGASDAATLVDGATGDGAVCTGSSSLLCVFGCGGDAGVGAVCTGGRWQCPPGTVDIASCPPTCFGPPPGPSCRCIGTSWECAPPTDAWCPVDLMAGLGTSCSLDEQLCGDPCCDATLVCRGGTWVEGPLADCLLCDSTQFFDCGGGACGHGQECQLTCGPTDGPIYRCVVIPSDCTNCDCAVVAPGESCTVRGGHVFVGEGSFCG